MVLLSDILSAKSTSETLAPREVKEILTHQISLPKEGLIREESKLFGFARTGAHVELAMKNGIDTALRKGFVMKKNGRVLIREGG